MSETEYSRHDRSHRKPLERPALARGPAAPEEAYSGGECVAVDSSVATVAPHTGAEFHPQKEVVSEIRTYAADGVVAYSSFCMHQGCDVSQWKHGAVRRRVTVQGPYPAPQWRQAAQR